MGVCISSILQHELALELFKLLLCAVTIMILVIRYIKYYTIPDRRYNMLKEDDNV